MSNRGSGALRAEKPPAMRLLLALNELSFSCAADQLIESEVERRRDARNTRTNLMNLSLQLATDRANEKLKRGASIADGFSEITPALAGTEQWATAPTPEGLRTEILTITDGLSTHAEEARRALHAGGAIDLDHATGPNTEGQPRSLELARLFDEADSLGRRIQIGMAMVQVVIDSLPGQLRTLGERLKEIEGELRAVLSMPSEHRPKGAGSGNTDAKVLADAIAEAIKRTTAEGRKRGRQPVYDPDDDLRISEAWVRARDNGTSKSHWCEDNNMTVEALNQLLSRVRKRQNRAN